MSKLNQSQVYALGQQVHSKEDLVNGLFEIFAQSDVKPAEIVTFVSLFDDHTFQDATHVLDRFMISQTPNKRRYSSANKPDQIQNRVRDVL